MQIGIRLHDTINGTLEERLAFIKTQGFVCGHLALSKVIKENSVTESALTCGYAMYLKKLFAQYNIDIAVLGCYLNLATPNEEQLKKNIDSYLAHIRFASILGCGVVGTETGAPNAEYKYEPACHTEKALALFIKNLKVIVEYAEKMGVIFAIEPVWNHIVYNPKTARKVLDEINSPNLQIILDPVNLLSIQNYENQEEIIKEAIELLGKDVEVVHLKDFEIIDGKMVSIAAGTGKMKYNSIIKFIKEQKPYIHITLENTNSENAVQSKEYIESIYKNI